MKRTITASSIASFVVMGIGLLVLSSCLGGPAPGNGVIDGRGPGSLVLNIKDACNDGRDTEFRVFGYGSSQPSGRPIGQGPESGLVFVARNVGAAVTSTYSCRTTRGQTVRSWCYGARARGATGHWGVGIDASERCTGCCTTCPSTGTSSRSISLVCIGGSNSKNAGGRGITIRPPN